MRRISGGARAPRNRPIRRREKSRVGRVGRKGRRCPAPGNEILAAACAT